MDKKPLIGFIGQGYIGKNYADDFERRGLSVVRYSQEAEYIGNKEKIKECDIVFIAVPTPTTPDGYDASVIKQVIPVVGKGKIVVLKSTILPGLTRQLQKEFPDYIIIHSPEFLSEATAAQDAANPFANIVGIPEGSEKHKEAAKLVHSTLPSAPFSTTVTSEEAELIKYTHNCSGYTQIVFFNMMYDLASKLGADWKEIEKTIKADPFIPNRYSQPVHKNGRGAGGSCFIKDFAAFHQAYKEIVGDKEGEDAIKGFEMKNVQLLSESKKNLDILEGVYGDMNNENF